jgi:hypothetical protein
VGAGVVFGDTDECAQGYKPVSMSIDLDRSKDLGTIVPQAC